jgi:hypothetical protein
MTKNVSDAEMQTTHDLTAKVAKEEQFLATLKEAEARLAMHSLSEDDIETKSNGKGNGKGNGEDTSRAAMLGSTALTVRNARPYAAVAKKVEPLDYLWRSLTCQLKHHTEQQKRPILEIVKEEYGEDERTRGVMAMISRAASIPRHPASRVGRRALPRSGRDVSPPAGMGRWHFLRISTGVRRLAAAGDPGQRQGHQGFGHAVARRFVCRRRRSYTGPSGAVLKRATDPEKNGGDLDFYEGDRGAFNACHRRINP